LKALQADLLTFERETLAKHVRRKDLAMQAHLLGQERERGKPNAHIQIVNAHAGILHRCAAASPGLECWHEQDDRVQRPEASTLAAARSAISRSPSSRVIRPW